MEKNNERVGKCKMFFFLVRKRKTIAWRHLDFMHVRLEIRSVMLQTLQKNMRQETRELIKCGQ